MVDYDRRRCLLHDEYPPIFIGEPSLTRTGSQSAGSRSGCIVQARRCHLAAISQSGPILVVQTWGKRTVFQDGSAVYTENPSFNNAYYRLAYRQELEHKKTAVQLIYRYTPHQLLGPGRVTSQSSEFGELRTTSHVWRAELQRQVTDRSSLTLIGRYGLRFYDEPFEERDTRFWSVGPQVEFALRSWSTITMAYLYERGLAAGRDDLQTDLDVSYYLHYALFGVRFELAKPLWLNLGYIYRFRGYTSDLAGDIELGRRDVIHQGTAEIRYAVSDALHLRLGFQQTQQHSTLQSRSFHSSTVTYGVEYRF